MASVAAGDGPSWRRAKHGAGTAGDNITTVKEFASRAEICLSLAYLLVAEGRVPHRRIGQKGRRGAIRISEEDYQQFMGSTKVQEVQMGA